MNTTPTTLQTQGTFSQLPQLIFDPASTSGSGASATRTPFPGNIIPTSRFSKVSSNIIPFIAAPNLPGLTNNHSYVNMTQITDRIWSLKVDHIFNDKNRISYFHSLDNNETYAVSDFTGPLGTGLGEQSQRPQSFRVNHDYSYTPTLLLHSTWKFTRQQQGWNVPAQIGYASKLVFRA